METCDRHPTARAVWKVTRVRWDEEARKPRRLILTLCNHCYRQNQPEFTRQGFVPVVMSEGLVGVR